MDAKDRLADALKKSRISKAKLARESGFDRSNLYRVLAGEIELTGAAAEKLAGPLGVSPAWLLGWTEDANTTEIGLKTARAYNIGRWFLGLPLDVQRIVRDVAEGLLARRAQQESVRSEKLPRKRNSKSKK